MIPSNRFSFGPPSPPADAEIVRRATGLRIDLWADKDSDIHGEIKITCGFGVWGTEAEDFDGSKQRESLAFVRRLVDAFSEKRKEGDDDDETGGMAAAG